MPTCLVSLGANLGQRREALDTALDRLRSHPAIENCVESGRLETPAVGGPPGQPPFLNSVARLETSIEPTRLLDALQAIERDAQRERGQRWAARRLDLDLLAYGERVLRLEGLRVPHPRMSFRPFVLEPAAEVAPEWRHPELRADLSRLLRVHREGADAVCLIGEAERGPTSTTAISQLLRLELPPRIVIGSPRRLVELAERGGVAETPRLTIDLRGDPRPPIGPRGPRLALADCPREDWREEVRAAIRCVWPREASGVS